MDGVLAGEGEFLYVHSAIFNAEDDLVDLVYDSFVQQPPSTS